MIYLRLDISIMSFSEYYILYENHVNWLEADLFLVLFFKKDPVTKCSYIVLIRNLLCLFHLVHVLYLKWFLCKIFTFLHLLVNCATCKVPQCCKLHTLVLKYYVENAIFTLIVSEMTIFLLKQVRIW